MPTLFGIPLTTPSLTVKEENTDLTVTVFGVTQYEGRRNYGPFMKFSVAIEVGDYMRHISTGLRLIGGQIKPPGVLLHDGQSKKVLDHDYFGARVRALMYDLVKQFADVNQIPINEFEVATAPLAITENRVKGLDKGPATVKEAEAGL